MRRLSFAVGAAVAMLATHAPRVHAAAPEHPAVASITALTLRPGAGRAEVVVAVTGTVEILDFALENPRRVVVDLRGAKLDMAARLYDKIARGGITNVRVAQFRPEVVRVVLDLDGPRDYEVVKGESDVRITVSGPDDFDPWPTQGVPGAGAIKTAKDAAAKANERTAQIEAQAQGTPAKPVAKPVGPAAPVRSSGAAGDASKAPVKGATQQDNRPLGRAPSVSAQSVSGEPRITVTYTDADIRDVIAAFAAFSGRTIVVGAAVAGKVNAEIADKPWDIAMQVILQSNNLAAAEDSLGIITVDSYANLAARLATEPLVTQVVPINYAKATVLEATVKALLGAGCGGAAPAAGAAPGGAPAAPVCSGRGSVASDDKTNTLLITETAARVADIVGYIRDLDVRTPQVSIKAKIIAVDRTGTEALGIAYDLGQQNTFSNAVVPRLDAAGAPITGEYRVNLSGDGFAGIANASRPYKATSTLQLIYNTAIGGFNLTSFVDALSSQELSDVQAEPSTTTLDNREATLFAGIEQAFLLTPPFIPGQIAPAGPQIQRQKIGITLKVTPHVTANRQISMNVTAIQQTLLSITQAGPSVSERNSVNEVLVNDGETLVIGGLTQTQVSKSKQGIPILMDLPGIGRLFSQVQTIERKQDLIILVTPRIVDEGEVVRAPTVKP